MDRPGSIITAEEVATLQAAGLTGLVERVLLRVRELLKKIDQQAAQIKELQVRLGQNSQNSSRPPSQDPPGAPPSGAKPKGEGKPGARPGHKGSHRELLSLDQVDAIVARDPDSCSECGVDLAQAPRQRLERWQITELPEIRPMVTEFQLWEKRCPCCGARTWGQLPGNGPRSAFGPNLQATVSLLSGAYHLTFSQVHNLLKDVFHLSMSIGSIQACRKVATQASAPACQALLAEMRAANVVHADETGFEQCQGTRMWLWVAVTPGAEVYLVLPGRGQAQAETLLGKDFSGVIERDRWKPYERFRQAQHQLCWSHIRRNLQGLIELPGETAVQAAMMKLASDKAFALWHAYQVGTLPRLQLARRMRPIRDEIHNRLRFILTDSGSTRRGLALAEDLLRQETSLWTYVRRKGVAPTNNAAERSLRPAVIWRKISYGARFPEGCRFVGSILTILGSAKRKGLDPQVWLTTAIRAVRLGEGPPLLLPA
jgi:transposase